MSEDASSPKAASTSDWPLWKTGLKVVLLVLTWQQLHDYYTTALFIEPVSVSNGLERAGVGSTGLTHEFADRLLALTSATNNILGNQTVAASSIHPRTLKSTTSEETVDIEVPDTKLSLKTITQILRHVLPFRPIPTVRGDASFIGGRVVLTFAVSDGGEPTSVNTWTAESDLAGIDDAVETEARHVLEIVDPIAAAINHYNHDVPFQDGLAAAVRILSGESRSHSKERAKNALVLWGSIEADRRRFPQSFGKFREAERLAGSEASILLPESAAWSAMGNSNLASAALEKALGMGRTAVALVSAGDAIREFSSAEAARFYREALEADTSYWPAYLGLSRVAEDDEDWPEATAYAHEAIRNSSSKGEQSSGYVQLADIELRRRHLEEAIRYSVRASMLDPAAVDPYAGIGRAEYLLGFRDVGDAAFERAVAVSSHRASLFKDWGDAVQIYLSDYAAAEKFYRASIAEDAGYEFGHGALGYLYFRTGKVPEGELEFEKAVAASEYPAHLHIDWGDGLAEAGQLASAYEHYRAAVTLDPKLCEARLALARARMRRGLDQGDSTEGNRGYRDALKICPHPEQVFQEWADAVPATRDLQAPIYTQWLMRDPGHAWARASLALDSGEPEAAASFRIGARAVTYPAGLYSLAALATAGAFGDVDRVRKYTRLARSLDFENTRASNLEWFADLTEDRVRGDPDAHLRNATEGSDSAFLGVLLLNKGCILEAEELLENSRRLNFDDPYVNAKLAEILMKTGRKQEAAKRLRLAAGIYLRRGVVSSDAEAVFDILTNGAPGDFVPEEMKNVYRTERERIRKHLNGGR